LVVFWLARFLCREAQKFARQMPFFLIDACFAGVFLWAQRSKPVNEGYTIRLFRSRRPGTMII